MTDDLEKAKGDPEEDGLAPDVDTRPVEEHRPIPDGGSESVQGGERSGRSLHKER